LLSGVGCIERKRSELGRLLVYRRHIAVHVGANHLKAHDEIFGRFDLRQIVERSGAPWMIRNPAMPLTN